ncbi:GNAT family N-acetyltransferase [Sneathiella litorea]|uniref:GNAT family N-acetyltransferase n=1 Tax=Sneathiella litorea TaxID=2606216 RepID=UPI0019294699|nr:GNAT family N-acyltransferase [Sneathiella litorea]
MEPLRFNNLELRLAQSAADLDAAQALRYRIFYEEMGAKPSALCLAQSRDVDQFDAICDHLLVIDLEKGTKAAPYVVGTYRFLRSSVAQKNGGFYSEAEFDLCNLNVFPGEIMELGRSCIDAGYRRRGAMQLLWRGIAAYIHTHEVQIMFGCGSIHGTNLKEHARVLSYLHHFHKAPGHLRPRALEEHYIPMKMMKRKEVDVELVQRELPPLLKGYLRLGGYIGDGAVIDHDFNTIDVCVIVETENVTSKYIRHFSRDRKEKAPTVKVTDNPVQVYS